MLTRGAVLAEQVIGGFAAVYPVLAALEERGAARRGYFVDGLGAAQFAVPGAVDRIRAEPLDGGRPRGGTAVVLAATDPANPYGAALPWPERVVDSGDATSPPATGHRAGRKAGALVVLVEGELALYVERGGRTLLSFTDDADALGAAGKALADAVHSGALGPMSVERADGESVRSSPLRDALTAAGFRTTPAASASAPNPPHPHPTPTTAAILHFSSRQSAQIGHLGDQKALLPCVGGGWVVDGRTPLLGLGSELSEGFGSRWWQRRAFGQVMGSVAGRRAGGGRVGVSRCGCGGGVGASVAVGAGSVWGVSAAVCGL
ncbi:hypothetical protein GCM10029963_29180 [Micromonospora andamanensis]